MSEPPTALLPIFRSAAQLKLLTFLFLHAGEEFSIAALSRQLGVPQPTVSREVERLVQAGILQAKSLGRSRLVAANREAPYFGELQSLLIKVAGPPEILHRLLSSLEGIVEAHIFGSWARRYQGEVGPFPHDIDLLVVGKPIIDEVYDAVRKAEEALGVEVNPSIVSPEEWEHPGSVFLSSVRSQPAVPVVTRS